MAAVFAGIGTSGLRTDGHGPWHADPALIALAVEIVLAVLVLTLRSIRRRSPEAGYPADRLRLVLHRTLSTTMGIVAAVVVSGLVWPSLQTFYTSPLDFVPFVITQRRFPSTYIRHQFGGLTRAEVGFLLYCGLALLLVLIVVACVLLHRRRGRVTTQGEVADMDGASLRQAIDSGREALHSVADARAAIIACYVAMEVSLSTAGAARGVGETADELLTRAARLGLLSGPAARQLTGLFYEARYSSHELPDAARELARQALDAIYADLTQPALAASEAAGA